MTQLKTLIMTLLLAFTSTVALAGAGHSHGPISQQAAEQRAERLATQLVNRGVLETSWKNRQLQSVEKTRRAGSQVWKASFTATSEQSKEPSLYLFMSLSGSYMDSNFTGQ